IFYKHIAQKGEVCYDKFGFSQVLDYSFFGTFGNPVRTGRLNSSHPKLFILLCRLFAIDPIIVNRQSISRQGAFFHPINNSKAQNASAKLKTKKEISMRPKLYFT
ncbi:MAG TPA: hypothetical protein DCZ91_25605, partial [Lachnospiraceae bacterium]|nr:hypothetical protein [Lachnospiraceae bacterium]